MFTNSKIMVKIIVLTSIKYINVWRSLLSSLYAESKNPEILYISYFKRTM